MMSKRCFKDNVYTITQKKWSLVDIYELFENFNIVTDNHTDKIVELLGGECCLFDLLVKELISGRVYCAACKNISNNFALSKRHQKFSYFSTITDIFDNLSR